MTLHVWSNGEAFVVADSAFKAALLSPADSMTSDWARMGDERTITIRSEGGVKTTRTCAGWAAFNGPGLLCEVMGRKEAMRLGAPEPEPAKDWKGTPPIHSIADAPHLSLPTQEQALEALREIEKVWAECEMMKATEPAEPSPMPTEPVCYP